MVVSLSSHKITILSLCGNPPIYQSSLTRKTSNNFFHLSTKILELFVVCPI